MNMKKTVTSGFTASKNASTFMYYSPNYLRINEQILLPPIFCLLMFLKFKVAARRMLWANNGTNTILLGYIDAGSFMLQSSLGSEMPGVLKNKTWD